MFNYTRGGINSHENDTALPSPFILTLHLSSSPLRFPSHPFHLPPWPFTFLPSKLLGLPFQASLKKLDIHNSNVAYDLKKVSLLRQHKSLRTSIADVTWHVPAQTLLINRTNNKGAPTEEKGTARSRAEGGEKKELGTENRQ